MTDHYPAQDYDPRHDDIQHILKHGFNGLVQEDFAGAPERLRAAYRTAWQRMYDYAFTEDLSYELVDDPTEKVIAIANRMLNDNAVLHDERELAFAFYWQKTSPGMLQAILCDDQPLDAYADQAVERRLEEILHEGDYPHSAEYLSRATLNYCLAVFFHRQYDPDHDIPPEDVRQGLHSLLTMPLPPRESA